MTAERRQIPRAAQLTGWRVLLTRVWSLILYSDTTPTRFMLAIAATFWCVLLAYPGHTFDRPVYLYMSRVAPEWMWSVVWGFHAVGMWWRTFSSVQHPVAALIINSLGVMLFTMAAISIFLTLTLPVPAAIAADLVFAVASFWVLIRTHINNGDGWRID